MSRPRLFPLLVVITLVASSCSLYGFGRNGDGQLGRGNTIDPTGSLTLVATDRSPEVLKVGPGNVCSIDAEARMYCWGGNTNGSLGMNDLDSRFVPTEVLTTHRWLDVTLEINHTCAVRTTGSLWCWGLGSEYQTGQGAGGTATLLFPHQVGSNTEWASVGSGFTHSCAIRTTGSLWCWGANDNAQTGTNAIGAPPVIEAPLQVGNGTDWATVRGGFDSSCARKITGELYCWGDNGSGQLGQGDTIFEATPAQVGTNTYSSFGTGLLHTCAVDTTGALFCWGNNGYGQLGVGDTAPRLSPAQVGTDTDWQSVTVGEYSTCGLRTSGTTWCWGSNLHGQHGNGTSGGQETSPIQVGTEANWTSIVNGGGTTCALRYSSDRLVCWGQNDVGQVGSGNPGAAIPTPTQITTATTWEFAAGGRRHSCGLKAGNGALYCWGDNFFGQLGADDYVDRVAPAVVLPPAGVTGWDSLATGAHHTCAVAQTNTLWCWGDNAQGQLGLGDFVGRDTPEQVGSDTDWQTVVAGTDNTCAVKQTGKLFCWGNNAQGQLGVGNFIAYFTPQAVASTLNFDAVDVDQNHGCAVRDTGGLWCWGDNTYGQLGLGNSGAPVPTPSLVDAAFGGAAVAVGTEHSCAINDGDELYCWGRNVFTGVGDTTGQSETPTLVDDQRSWAPETLSAGYLHTCALSAASGGANEPFCWGLNLHRQIDPASIGNIVDSPFLVAVDTGWQTIATGTHHTLVIRTG